METTKIHLSADELALMHNEQWILTKNRVIEKLSGAMGHLGMQMQQKVQENAHKYIPELLRSNPKVSRGEKYGGLPYIILDYPRIFEKENILAVRTFFWWGNFCSITLHVNGRYQPFVLKKLVDEYQGFQEQGFYLSLSGNEWNHDLTTSDYQLLSSGGVSEIKTAILNSSFLKLSAKVELKQWIEMETELYEIFLVLLKLLEI